MAASDATNERSPHTSRGGVPWLAWVLAIVLSLVAAGYLVVRPLAERALEGVGTMVGGMLQAVAATVEAAYALACQQIAASDEAQALFGEPIAFAPLEQTQWLETDNDELKFEFAVRGPQGAGQAHVVAMPSEARFELKSIVLTGPQGETVELPLP